MIRLFRGVLATIVLSSCSTLAAGQADFPSRSIASPASSSVALPSSLQFTLEALGASSGVPDGLGGAWYSNAPVRGQPAGFVLSSYQGGVTLPLATTDSDGLFGNASISNATSRTTAVLPVSKSRFPADLWNVQLGGGYVQQRDSGWSWGFWGNVGSASDRPFRSIAGDTISGLAFVRLPWTDETGWLLYIVSTTSGQFGRNIPIPGIAYEFQFHKLKGAVGFPFVTLNYRPENWLEFDFNYAALTDVLARMTIHPYRSFRIFADYVWTNESWFRADRTVRQDQLFRYEMRVEGGLGWSIAKRCDLRATAGYAFDRFFVENSGYSLTGPNRIDLAPGPFVAAQFELRY